ncbi:hypothetical protein BASA50_001740 [Batrachochytrium salamandrivorans]|uniref:Uncharacterized protein n=1 Tax=Batrachochytrium salamandrivorans TaxID=1357716 RepID=A0ABQ8FNB1_9FUNG|nr:hypothetical protein BASA62_007486 [Batrachochytrium salamandrivorans]KAH6580429.1 hypothetical protein BASA61_009661 [Batrachochytrium salamandrivorans]KAH6582721.1 hypothetical protein BASA60_001782 [Batrachochytrium salamandrivorans]KAH6601215.1 hypothetical protein BASA50_001740 [Batrachochytrium salamandrivorans]KAH9250990.1 hypothetical protein BASA81_011164 [Batrachochytrium salamandrivorans]
MLLVVPSEPRREGPSLRTSDTSIETLFDASSDVYADSECTTNHLLTTVSTEEWKALGKTHHQSTSQARSGRSTWKIASLFATPSAAENKPRSPLFQSEIASQKSTRRPSWTKFNEIPSGLVRLFKRCTLSRTSRQKTAIAPDLDDDVLFDLRRDPETVQGLSAPHIQAEAMSTAVPAGGWAEQARQTNKAWMLQSGDGCDSPTTAPSYTSSTCSIESDISGSTIVPPSTQPPALPAQSRKSRRKPHIYGQPRYSNSYRKLDSGDWEYTHRVPDGGVCRNSEYQP